MPQEVEIENTIVGIPEFKEVVVLDINNTPLAEVIITALANNNPSMDEEPELFDDVYILDENKEDTLRFHTDQ